MTTRLSASVLEFRSRSRDWTQQELAEFYRVESALINAGLSVVVDRGLSDEGEPWFVFCRESDGEVLVHFAKIEGDYVVAASAFGGIVRGQDIRSIVSDLLKIHNISSFSHQKRGTNIFLHPAALLVAIIGVAYFKSSAPVQAGEKTDASDQVPSKLNYRLSGTSSVISTKIPTENQAQSATSVEMNPEATALLLSAILSLETKEAVAHDNAFGALPVGTDNSGAETRFLAPRMSLDQQQLAPISFDGNDSRSNFDHLDLLPVQATAEVPVNLMNAPNVNDLLRSLTQIPAANSESIQLIERHISNYGGHAPPNLISISSVSDYKNANKVIPTSFVPGITTNNIPNSTEVATGYDDHSTSAFQMHVEQNMHKITSQSLLTNTFKATNLNPLALQNLDQEISITSSMMSATFFLQKNDINVLLTSNNTKVVTFATAVAEAPVSQVYSGDGVKLNKPLEITPTDSGHMPNGQTLTTYLTPGETDPNTMLNSDLFAKILLSFVYETPGVQVSIINANQFLFYSGAVATSLEPTGMSELLITFADGSSVGIVGQTEQINGLITHGN